MKYVLIIFVIVIVWQYICIAYLRRRCDLLAQELEMERKWNELPRATVKQESKKVK